MQDTEGSEMASKVGGGIFSWERDETYYTAIKEMVNLNSLRAKHF